MLTTTEQQRIADAIAAIERESGGEILVSVTRQSSAAPAACLLVGIGLAMVAASLAQPLPFLWTALLQVGVIGTVSLSLHLAGLGLYLLPEAARRAAVTRQAHEHFLRHGVHATDNRAGVLLFVSRRERMAVLVADRGIETLVPAETWRGIAQNLERDWRAGPPLPALLSAIESCGALLRQHVPIRPGTQSRLADRPQID